MSTAPSTNPPTSHTEPPTLTFALTALAQQTAEPWRAELAKRKAQMERFKATTVTAEERICLFAALAKESLLSPDEVVALTYVVVGSDYDRSFYASILLLADPHEVVVRHNYHVAVSMGEDFIERYGSLLPKLRLPLFPGHAAFTSLNVKLLSLAKQGATGGGEGGNDGRKMFRRGATDGGGHVPVLSHEGNLVADVTVIEGFAQRVNTQLQDLQKQVADLRRTPRGVMGNNRQFNNNNASHNNRNSYYDTSQIPNRGRGRGYGGRGRARGGDFPEDDDQTKLNFA